MNNKKLGNEFEVEMCDILAQIGYWVHFVVPDSRGAQPFDIIAVKDNKAYAIDCKTCVKDVISIDRLEENQILAFDMWMRRGNGVPIVAVKHEGSIYLVPYTDLKVFGKVALTDDLLFHKEGGLDD